MANTSILDVAAEQYSANIHMQYQQTSARLARYGYRETLTGQAHYFEKIGVAAAQAEPANPTNQTGGTPNLDPGHTKRVAFPGVNEWGTMKPRSEALRSLADPQSMYVRLGVAELNREKDLKFIAALEGNATDVTMNLGAVPTFTPVALPAGQQIAHGSTNLTLLKLLEAKEIMDANEVPDGQDVDPVAMDSGERILAFGSAQLRYLLDDDKLTSADYATVKALVEGKINTFLGFRFVRSELLTVAANIRSCFAFHGSAIGIAVPEELDIQVGPDPSQRFQVRTYVYEQCGVTRIWDEGVVQIDCDETDVPT